MWGSDEQANAGFSELAEWAKRIEKLNSEIDQAESRWMELMEMESV